MNTDLYRRTLICLPLLMAASVMANRTGAAEGFVAVPFDHQDTKDTKLQSQAAHAVLKQRDIEIDEQAQPESRELEIGQELRLMEARQRLDRFDLDDHDIRSDEIQAQSAIESETLVANGEGDLTTKRDGALRQFMGKTELVDRLEQAGPKGSVHLHGRVDDLAGDGIRRGRDTLVFLVFLVVQRSPRGFSHTAAA